MKELGALIGGFVLFIFLILGLDYGLGLKWFEFIETKKEDARHKVFKSTRSFNEAQLQDLVRYRLQYIQGDDATKAAIASAIRHMYADYDENKLPLELEQFLRKIKYGKQREVKQQ